MEDAIKIRIFGSMWGESAIHLGIPYQDLANDSDIATSKSLQQVALVIGSG